jgi:hypothetical protein
MSHYRCQNVYILATASEHIADKLEFVPHNYQMPHLSSTDRLIMAANDMTNALQSPHPEVPFTHIGDDTISALTALVKKFKLKFQKAQISTPPAPPAKVTQHTCLTESSNPISASPIPPPRYTRSQTKIHARDTTNAPLLPRVVTPITSQPSPPRVPRRSQNLSPQLVPRGLLQHGHFPPGHLPGKSPLAPAAPSHCTRSPHHRKRNGIHGPYERPPSVTTLDTRFWQQSRAYFPRHSGHSWNRNMFLYQTYKHPKRQPYH